MNQRKFIGRSVVAFAAGLIVAAAQAAEPLVKPATPGSDKSNAGIIILDGKTPPGANAGGKVATGIGLGGCAACDKPELDAKTKASASKAATAKLPAKADCPGCDKPSVGK